MWSDQSSQGEELTFTYPGKANKLIGFSIISTLLTLVTLTIYRFWANNQLRKRIWAGAEINGQPLEYTGRGMELFLGFLIAIFVLGLPILAFSFGFQVLLGQNPVLAFVAVFVFYAYLFVIMPVAIWRMRRYILSRTNWRGIRFSQRGNEWGYVRKSVVAVLQSIITLGWAVPGTSLRLAGHLWNQTWFGETKFSFDPKGHKEPLKATFAVMWVSIIIFYAVFGYISYQAATSGVDPSDPTAAMAMYTGGAGIAILVAYILFFIGALTFYCALTRAIASCVRIEGVKFSLRRYEVLPLVGLALTNGLIILFSLGFLMPLTHLRTFRFIFSRIEAEGKLNLAALAQSTDKGPGQGEGLADGMDLGAGF